MTAYTKKAFWNFFFMLLGILGANVFGYLTRIVLARQLSVAEYGVIYAVIALFGLTSIFQNLGLSQAIAKYVAKYAVKKNYRKIKEVLVICARIMYGSTALLACLAFLLSDLLSTAYFQTSIAGSLVRIFAIATLLSPIWMVVIATFDGLQRFELRAVGEFFNGIVLFVATLCFLALGFGVQSYMYAYIVFTTLAYVFFLPLLARYVPGIFTIKTTYSKKTLRMLFTYGLPVMFTGVAGMVLTYTDTALLTLFSGLEEVGIYQTALPTANILLFFVGGVTSVLLPLVAELWERKKHTLITQATTELYKYAFVSLLPLLLAIFMYPDIILNLLFGGAYLAGAPVLQILAIAALFLTLHAVNTATLAGMGFTKLNMQATITGAACNLGMNIVLIPLYGGTGAAISTLSAAILMFCISTYLLGRKITVRVPFLQWAKSILCAGVFVGILWTTRSMVDVDQYVKIVLSLILGSAAYVFCIWATRTITLKEALAMKKRIF
ncbi:MAG: flippase [Candidatus Woesearchaeota archaeon]|nr:flippase [Candidatus Woesearchaeota archaeon]